MAGVTQDVRLEGHLFRGTEGGIFERNVNGHLLVLTATYARGRTLRGSSEAAAEHGLENIGETGEGCARASSSAAQRVWATDVVHLTLLRVGQGLVGNREFFEGLFRVGPRIIGVKLTRTLAVCLLDLFLARIAGDAEDLVIVSHACSSFPWGAIVMIW